MEEVWKEIEGYDGYEVSTMGRVRSYRMTGRSGNFYDKPKILLSDKKTTLGIYHRVTLYKNKKPKKFAVHRLVAKAFIPNPENKPEVNHIDGDRSNNCLDNLEWVTKSENHLHAFRAGLRKPIRGEQSNMAKLKKEDVLEIRHRYREGGISQYDLADEYNVSQPTINMIINKVNWAHL